MGNAEYMGAVLKSHLTQKGSILEEKTVKMKAVILISMLICLVPLNAKPTEEVEEDFGCQRTDKRAIKNDQYIGKCLTEHKGRFWCYVKDDKPECVQGKTAKFPGWGVNFDLCDSDFIDFLEVNERVVDIGK